MAYNLKNQRFSYLFVLERIEDRKQGKCIYWKCLCDCGNITVVDSYSLRIGHTKSCGCFSRERFKKEKPSLKHGYYNTRTYHTWEGMKQRCLNPNATRYPSYGAMGITVCERWLNFQNFLEDMGPRPEKMTLDRINPFGNYEPSNCRWATLKEQQNNQRRHKLSEEGNLYAGSM